MKIKKVGDLLLFDTAKAKAVFPLTEEVKKIDASDIILITKTDSYKNSESLIVDSAGEYEIKDIFVYALSKTIDNIDLFSMDVEGMNIVVFNSNDNIVELLDSEHISENNILICNVNGDFSKVAEVIDELEPDVFILVGVDEVKIAEVVKKLSLTTGEAQTNFTFTEEDFESEEEKPMQVLLLK